MPIYEYKCGKGHVFDAIQKMTDDPLTSCEQCGAPVERVFHPVAVHFKGSGFYTTDYGKKKASGNDGGKESKESGGSGESKASGSSSDSKPSESKSKSDSKPAASAGD